MDDITDILDDQTNLEVDEKEQARLDKIYQNRTQVDINEPFYKGSKAMTHLAQFGSVILGIGVCIRMAEKFPDIAPIIFGGCLLLLCLWEFAIRCCLHKINQIRIINKSKKIKLSSSAYRCAAAFLVSGSLASGYIGAPHVIEKFSSHEILKDIESIRVNAALIMDNHKEIFTGQKLEVFAMAALLHKESSFKGVTSRKVRTQKADLIVIGAGKDEKLNNAVTSTTERMNKDIDKATDSNEEIVKEHKEWCSSFGAYASLGNLFLSLALFVLMRWCSNHEDRKRKENKAKIKILKEQGKDVDNHGGKDKDANKDLHAKDGDIVPTSSGNAHYITITHTDGNLKTYKSGSFRSYFNSGSMKRKGELLHYLNKLNRTEGKDEIILETLETN